MGCRAESSEEGAAVLGSRAEGSTCSLSATTADVAGARPRGRGRRRGWGEEGNGPSEGAKTRRRVFRASERVVPAARPRRPFPSVATVPGALETRPGRRGFRHRAPLAPPRTQGSSCRGTRRLRPLPHCPPPAMVALPSPLRGRADRTDDSTRSRRGGRTRAGLGLQPALGERGSKPPAPLWGVPVGWPRRSLKRGAGTPEALSAYSRGIWKPSELSRLFFGLPVSSAPDWVREDCT